MTTNGNDNMELHLCISDTDLCEELKKHEEGEDRDAFAIRAMRIGIIAIRHAQGQIYAEKIRGEGNRIMEKTESTLTNYLDPDKGKFHQQIQQLIKKDGELEKAILRQIEGSDSPLNQTLAKWIGEILKEFKPDDKDSALGRLGKKLQEKHNEFIEKLDQRIGSKKAAQNTTKGGIDFEKEGVLKFIHKWSQKANHTVTHTGNKLGLERTRKGDLVIKLEPEHAAAGCKIVVEAKADKTYTLDKALKELEEARKNRGAEVGLFVFDKNKATDDLDRFTRRGNDIVIVWNAEDYNNDVVFEAGLSLAVALCVKAKTPSKGIADREAMDNAISKIENEVKRLEEITQSANNIKKTSDNILKKAEEMRRDLEKQIRILKENIDGIR